MDDRDFYDDDDENVEYEDEELNNEEYEEVSEDDYSSFSEEDGDEQQYEEGEDESGDHGDFNTGYSFHDQMERRLTPSQAEMVYLLDADDVPPHLRPHVWAIVSRHLSLIDIPDYRRLIALRGEVRDIIRTSTWKRGMDKLSYSDLIQIEFYAFLLLSKSLNRGERTLLATSIQRTQVEDYGERTPLQPMYNNGGLRGMLGNLFR